MHPEVHAGEVGRRNHLLKKGLGGQRGVEIEKRRTLMTEDRRRWGV